MTNTPHLGMPFIEGSQAQKHITHNEALRILDAAIQIGVLDTDRTAPPSTPAEGDRHIVASGATGAWTGQEDAVAVYEDGAWRCLTPKSGWCAWSEDDGALLVYDGTAWVDVANGGSVMSDSVSLFGINGSASDPNLLTVRSNAALFNAIDAADGGTGDVRVQISKEGSANTASVVFSDAFSGRAEFGLVESDAFKLKVSSDGATFVEAITIDQSTGNAAFQRGLALTGVISPSQITSAQNNYAPTGFAAASTLRLSSDASRSITGLAGGVDGRTIIVHNVGSQSIVLTNQDAASTAANRFLLGGDATLAADASLSLRYDGTTQRWRAISPVSSASSGGGGGGAAGMTDAERQNSGLGLIYQSKSLAESRRLVNVLATGFKGASDALNAILTGSSSNYAVTAGSAGATTGYVAPTASSTSQISTSGTTKIGNMTGGGGLAAAFDGVDSQTDSVSAKTTSAPSAGYNAFVGIDWGSGVTKTVNQFTVIAPTDDKINGVGVTTIKLQGSTDNFASSVVDLVTSGSTAGTNGESFTVSSGINTTTAYRYHRIAINMTGGGAARVAELKFYAPGSANNMTLVTAMQTADSTVSNGRVLIEYDNAAAPALNTDLTVEVTCDGGAHWTAAALSAVTSNGQGGRKVAESVDQACTAGTFFAARLKTLNNKNVPVYGLKVEAH